MPDLVITLTQDQYDRTLRAAGKVGNLGRDATEPELVAYIMGRFSEIVMSTEVNAAVDATSSSMPPWVAP